MSFIETYSLQSHSLYICPFPAQRDRVGKRFCVMQWKTYGLQTQNILFCMCGLQKCATIFSKTKAPHRKINTTFSGLMILFVELRVAFSKPPWALDCVWENFTLQAHLQKWIPPLHDAASVQSRIYLLFTLKFLSKWPCHKKFPCTFLLFHLNEKVSHTRSVPYWFSQRSHQCPMKSQTPQHLPWLLSDH